MPTLLAADIGGTKTLLQVSNDTGEVLAEQRFASKDFAGFTELLAVSYCPLSK